MSLYLLTFLVSLLVAVLLVATKRWHSRLTADHVTGIQKMHVGRTPRVGGVPVYAAVFCAWAYSSDPLVKDLLCVLLLAGSPAFVFGLAEDLSKRVGVGPRLLATLVSGVLAWWLTDISLSRVDVLGIDFLLQWVVLSVAFSAFAIAGIANAVNIIDGMNGLVGIAVCLMLMSMAFIARDVGDQALLVVIVTLALAVFGFFLLNWPWGKLFLGDGGAYFIGFSLAWLSVLLIERHESVSAFAPLLICIHPVTEVLFSIYRRRQREDEPGQPDRLHFHSLLKRRYIKRLFPNYSLIQRNSIAGLLVGSMSVWGLLWIPWVYDSTALCMVGVLLYLVLYVIFYMRMARHAWIFRR